MLTTGFDKDEIFVVGTERCSLSELEIYLVNIQKTYENVFGEEIAATQEATVSVASHGRHTLKFGMERSMVSCSTGSCVGPSSPTPILSCVNMKMCGMLMRADRRAIGLV